MTRDASLMLESVLLSSWAVLLTAAAYNTHSKSTGLREYCSRETFNASCGEDEVVVMEEAMYGRMRVGKCVQRNLGYLGCSSNVTAFLVSQCSGRQHCQVPVGSDELYQTHPCPKDTTSHLEASYSCLPVLTDKKSQCQQDGQIKLTADSGYLATRVTEEYGYGSASCPWVIKVREGYQLNLTLHNFGRSLAGLGDPSVCYELATVVEGTSRRNVMTCGTDGRDKTVYISRTPTIEVHFADPSVLKTLGAFLIKYQVSKISVTAAGCPALKVVGTGWVQRNGDKATVTCNYTDQTFTLECQKNKWIGPLGNCSQVTGGKLLSFLGDESFPYGILIVVAIGVALGVFLGGLLLSVAIFYLKRRQGASSDGDDRRTSLRDCKDGGEEGQTFHWGTFGTHTLTHPHIHTHTHTDPTNRPSPTKPGTPDPYGTTHVVAADAFRPGRAHIYEAPAFS